MLTLIAAAAAGQGERLHLLQLRHWRAARVQGPGHGHGARQDAGHEAAVRVRVPCTGLPRHVDDEEARVGRRAGDGRSMGDSHVPQVRGDGGQVSPCCRLQTFTNAREKAPNLNTTATCPYPPS